MSGLMDKVKDFASDKLDQKSQPGNSVERKADSGVNDSECSSPNAFQEGHRIS